MAAGPLGQLQPPALKKGSPLTKRASGRALAKLAKAASISRLVLALRTWICSPMVKAASSTSLNMFSACRSMGRIDEHGHACGGGHQFTQEFQLFRANSRLREINTCQVAARPGEAGDKTTLDRVFGGDEDDCELSRSPPWPRTRSGCLRLWRSSRPVGEP